MATLLDLKLAYRLFMKSYPYRKVDWRPGAKLKKPIDEARIAVVSTAAFHTPDQPPFDASIKGGDWSYRVLDANVDLATLKIAHRSDAFDVRGLEADKNLALPLDRLKSLAREGVIGEVAPHHFSFMGSIAAPGRLIAESAPRLSAALMDDAVDAVLLTPI
jgi:D-proline reductase (dithiol) PrdB